MILKNPDIFVTICEHSVVAAMKTSDINAGATRWLEKNDLKLPGAPDYNSSERDDRKEPVMKAVMKAFLPVVALMFVLNGCQAMTGETLGEHIDDTTITTSVKTKLAAEKGATLTRIQVDTDRGVVQLSGVVDSAAEKARAEQIARGVSGVKSVKNNLQTR
jgi:hypothetical protein